MTISSVAETRSDNRSNNKRFQDERSNHRNSSNHSRRANNHSNGRNERVNRNSNRRYDQNNHNSSRQYNRGYSNSSRHYYGFGHRKSYLPLGYLALTFAGLNYFYNSGSYYRRIGHEYAVIRPPLGIGISILPAGYRTIYHGRSRYYTANGIFYSWNENRRNYIVVNNPNTQALSGFNSKNISEQYIYPRQGQNNSQTSRDRYECYLWAVDKTGVEPAQISDQHISNELENYQRANGACLEARGYSVK
jgi:hypothetical protein